jgi:hypothetical protein
MNLGNNYLKPRKCKLSNLPDLSFQLFEGQNAYTVAFYWCHWSDAVTTSVDQDLSVYKSVFYLKFKNSPIFTPTLFLCISSLFNNPLSPDSSVCIKTRLWPKRPRYRGFDSLCRLCNPSKLLKNLYRSCFLGGKVAGAWSSPLISIQCRGQEWWRSTSTPLYIFKA